MEETSPEIRPRLKDSAVNTPTHMLIAMGILSLLCLFLGLFPPVLYGMLPYPMEFVPYTVPRVFSMTQSFGSSLDRGILRMTGSIISTVMNPKFETAMTPRAIGFGIFIVMVLFSIFIVKQI